MTGDIVARLRVPDTVQFREYKKDVEVIKTHNPIMLEAADEIEKWRKIAKDLYIVGCHSPDCGAWDDFECDCTYQFAEEAYEEAANV
jgi:hypothetical protein